MLERNALIPLEVNLKKETSTLLWYWPCSGKLPCFLLPTLGYQCEMFTSRIRLNVSFLRSLTPVLSMYISEKKRAISLTKQPARAVPNPSILLCKTYLHFDILVWAALKCKARFSQNLMKMSILHGIQMWKFKLPRLVLNLHPF